jgi:hypothetical protein
VLVLVIVIAIENLLLIGDRAPIPLTSYGQEGRLTFQIVAIFLAPK